jgi:c-di-GMP-binding flagellar brake protein YcgR
MKTREEENEIYIQQLKLKIMKTKEEQVKIGFNYLEQTSKHVFMTESGNFLRIAKDEDGKWYEYKNEIKSSSHIDLNLIFSYYSDMKQYLKLRLFPKDHGYKSIRRSVFNKIKP